jgi:hypothetical protein
MKKIYQKPAMQAVVISQKCKILSASSSSVQSVGGNAGFNAVVSGGSGTARGRQVDIWGDEDDEEGMN